MQCVVPEKNGGHILLHILVLLRLLNFESWDYFASPAHNGNIDRGLFFATAESMDKTWEQAVCRISEGKYD
jgi:hypothetical protein